MLPGNLYKEQAAIYDFLRELFFSTWQSKDLNNLIKKADFLPQKLRQTSFIQHVKMLDEAKLRNQKYDFNQLFIGPSKPLCPPFESFYNEKGILNQNLSIEHYYEQIGLSVKQRDFLSDFIGIHCEFLYCIFFILCDTYQSKRYKYEVTLLQIKDKFIQEHIKTWLPFFIKDIEQKANSDFFKSFAVFLHKAFML